ILLILFFACHQVNETLSGKVIGISDGDTIKILHNGKVVKIRLFGVDSPEKSQPYGKKAKDFTSQLTFEKNVSIIIHGKDRYDRVIGEVILPDGRNLNEELLKNGFAWHFTRYSNSRRFQRLEEKARKEKVGLW